MSRKARHRTWESVVACLLAFTLAFSMMGTAFASPAYASEQGEVTKKVVSLGDSMTNGLGHNSGYDETGHQGYREIATTGYPALFANWLAGNEGPIEKKWTKDDQWTTFEGPAGTVELTQLATSCMRVEDLQYILEYGMPNAYQGDIWTQRDLLCSGRWGDDAAEVAEVFQTAVRDADVVLYAAGNCNIGVYLLDMTLTELGAGSYGYDYSYATFENAIAGLSPEAKAIVEGIYDEAMTYFTQALPADLAYGLVDCFTYVAANYLKSFAGSFDRIVELNPDADIVLVGLMNTMSGFDFYATYQGQEHYVNLADAFDFIVEPLNAYMATYAAAKQAAGMYGEADVFYAEVEEIETLADTYNDEYTKETQGFYLKRFVDDIVGIFPAMGMGLIPVTPEDIIEYREFPSSVGGFIQYLCAIGALSSDGAGGLGFDMMALAKANSVLAYEGIEGAILASLVNTPHIDIDAMTSGEAVADEALEATAPTAAAALAAADDEGAVSGDVVIEAAKEIIALVTGRSASDVSDYEAYALLSSEQGSFVIDLVSLYAIPSYLEAYLAGDGTMSAFLAFYGRMALADGMSAHPSEKAHRDLFAKISEVYASAHSVQDEIVSNVLGLYQMLLGYAESADAEIIAALQGVAGKLSAELERAVFDATHGEYAVTDASRYVAIGDGTIAGEGSYADLLAAEIAAVAAEAGLSFDPASQFAKLSVESDGPVLAEDVLAAIESGEWDEQIASADLITLSMGQENMTVAANERTIAILESYVNALVAEKAYEPAAALDWASLVGADGAQLVQEALARIQAELAAQLGDEGLAAVAADVLASYAFGYFGFAASCCDALDAVRAVNPDAQVVAVGLSNVLDGLVLSFGESGVDLGEYAGYVVGAADLQYLAYSLAKGGVTFASAPEAQSDAASVVEGLIEAASAIDFESPKLDQLVALSKAVEAFTAAENWMPNAEGQAYILDRVLLEGEGDEGALAVTAKAPAEPIDGAVVEVADAVYAAEALEPEVVVTLDGEVLAEGVDFEVEYAGNVEVGTAVATVTGIGAYEGAVEAAFEIGHLATAGSFPDFSAGRWYLNEAKGAFEGQRTLFMDYALAKGLMGAYSSGANAGCFGPHDKITRASVATILYRAACAEDPALEAAYGSTTDKASYGQTASFSDMQAGKWYTAAVNWARDAGVMTGDGTTGYTTVRPNDTVTRQELAVMLARYAAGTDDLPAVELDPAIAASLGGVDEVSGWARNGMFWALNEGVVGGTQGADGTRLLNPKANAERCEAAKMVSIVLRDIM